MDTFAATLDLIRKKPEIIPILKRIIDYEEEHKNDQYFKDLGWEYDDYKPPIKPQTLYQFFLAGVLDKPYDSRSHTGYLLFSREDVRRAIEEYETMEEPIEVGGPVVPPEDLFSSIVGYEDVKDVFHRALESEEVVWILLTGPPASAKTMFMLEIQRLPGSYFALGSRSTKAGLSTVLIDSRPRYLIIDELERMDTRDMDVLLSLYQTGLVVETKFPKPRRAQLKTWVFACFTKNAEVLTNEGWFDIGSLVGERAAEYVWDGYEYARILGFWHFPYSGKLIRLEFENGETLHTTPNHLFLTPSGWVPAKLLTSEVLVTTKTHERDRSCLSSRDDRLGWVHNMPKIQEKGQKELSTLYATRRGSYPLSSGCGFSEIHRLSCLPEKELSLKTCSEFKCRAVGMRPMWREKGGSPIKRTSALLKRKKGTCKDSPTVYRNEAYPSKEGLHRRRDRVDGTLKVAEVTVMPYSGYIYDLTTVSHRYSANGIVVHNSANTLKGIPRELLSRFLRFRFREYDRPQFMKTVTIVLQTRENVNEKLATYIAQQVWFELDSKDPRDAVRIARLCKTEKQVNELITTMKKYRNRGN